ncbi:nucleotidyltransferase domain-containing protein [Candidatus Daviesbacteria bacterium]|nr:nucleotidyltransferase domain-containing protein [Candidatus Daviesbacteria bacterium]
MEKAILKTSAYADIFDYPLKPYEIHKWLISKKATTHQVEKAIKRLEGRLKVKSKDGYIFLPGRQSIVKKRINREKQSQKYLFRAKIIAFVFKIIPWIKLVGVSGSLAVENAQKDSDIDLFIITSYKRMWLSRMLTIWITDFLGIRRERENKQDEVLGKVCLNLYIDQNNLEQENKDLYTAHEVLQMRVLWQRENTYKKFLDVNSWVFEFLPNWATGQIRSEKLVVKPKPHILTSTLDFLERIAGRIQRKYMGKPTGAERISDKALFFHPEDCRLETLEKFKRKTRLIF